MKTKIFLKIAILFSLPFSLFGQLFEIHGIVSDENKAPISGVFVKLNNTPYSTLSDSLGNFRLITISNKISLKFIKNGYEDLLINVENLELSVNAILKGKMIPHMMGRRAEMKTMDGLSSRAEIAEGSFDRGRSYETPSTSDMAISDPLSPSTSRTEEHLETSVKGIKVDAIEVSSEGGLTADTKLSGISYSTQKSIKAGQLTAGELNDFSKWLMWSDLNSGELEQYKKIWNIFPINRYTIQLANDQGLAVVGAKVRLIDNNSIEWESVTDNTGKAELWLNSFISKLSSQTLVLDIDYHGKNYKINNPKRFNDGINFLTIPYQCNELKKVDIGFLIDATGSMGDEIAYLKSELLDIMQRAKDSLSLDLQLGSVFYRDKTDEYLFKYSQFSDDLLKSTDFIKNNDADGGGDFPEAVDIALDMTLNSMNWRDSSFSKILFLLLDAPPHDDKDILENIELLTREYSKRGIRIIPIVCSGVDKSTEYLMRSLALLTNGTYVFLTDDSGIGDKHIKPSTDNWNVEMLNDLVYRLIYQYTNVSSCVLKGDLVKQDTMIVVDPSISEIYPSKDAIIKSNELSQNDSLIIEKNINDKANAISWKYYPNPCYGILKLDVKGSIGDLFITDISGKILVRVEIKGDTYHEIDLHDYPSGTYFIRYEYSPNKYLSGKFLLLK